MSPNGEQIRKNENEDHTLSNESKEMLIKSLEKTLERREQNTADPEASLTEEYYNTVEEVLNEAKKDRATINPSQDLPDTNNTNLHF